MIKTKENQPEFIQKSNNWCASTTKQSLTKINKKATIQKKQIPQQCDKQSYESLSHLVFEYKLSLEYSPAIGIYIVPEVNNFYNWEFYLFLRQGYYKDAKLKGIIKFDKFNKIVEASFFSPVYHPLVEFKTGKIDLQRLSRRQKSALDSSEVFIMLLKLKQMFTNEQYLLIKDSLNEQAAKIYQKSEVLFIEKVFQTTVIALDSNLFQNPILSEQNKGNEEILLEEQEIESLRQKLKEIVLNSSTLSMQRSFTESQKDQQQSIDSKVSRFLQLILP